MKIMKVTITLIVFLFSCASLFSQVDNQKRLQSDTRKCYVWNGTEQKYELIKTEYEHSIIDIREIGSKTNGYIVVSLHDNGLTQLHHGSIYNYTKTSENEGTWLIKSKNSKAKMTYNPKDNTLTYLYDGDTDRYRKLMIFTVTPDELPSSSIRTLVKND